MTDDPKIKYVAWRRGRPRFEPSPSMRARDFKGEDLKNADGDWMTAGEALQWSRALVKQLADDKRRRALKAGKPRAKATPVPQPALRAAFPVRQLFDEWLNLVKNPSMGDRMPNTIRDYRQKAKVFENHLPDVWNAEAEALTKPICLGIYDQLRSKTGIPTASGAMRILGIALQWAMDRDRLKTMHSNPAHKLKMKTPEPRLRFATREEIAHLVATADEIGRPEMGDMVTFAVWSGQRQQDRLVYGYAGREKGRMKFKQLKTGALVSIIEAPELTKRLEASIERRKQAGIISPYVVLDERTRVTANKKAGRIAWAPFKPDYYRHLFEDLRFAAKAGMPSIATLRDQDLRDTAVTWLAMAGCTIPEICSITGHSLKTAHDILKHYLAMNEELADSAIQKLIAWYDKGEAE